MPTPQDRDRRKQTLQSQALESVLESDGDGALLGVGPEPPRVHQRRSADTIGDALLVSGRPSSSNDQISGRRTRVSSIADEADLAAGGRRTATLYQARRAGFSSCESSPELAATRAFGAMGLATDPAHPLSCPQSYVSNNNYVSTSSGAGGSGLDSLDSPSRSSGLGAGPGLSIGAQRDLARIAAGQSPDADDDDAWQMQQRHLRQGAWQGSAQGALPWRDAPRDRDSGRDGVARDGVAQDSRPPPLSLQQPPTLPPSALSPSALSPRSSSSPSHHPMCAGSRCSSSGSLSKESVVGGLSGGGLSGGGLSLGRGGGAGAVPPSIGGQTFNPITGGLSGQEWGVSDPGGGLSVVGGGSTGPSMDASPRIGTKGLPPASPSGVGSSGVGSSAPREPPVSPSSGHGLASLMQGMMQGNFDALQRSLGELKPKLKEGTISDKERALLVQIKELEKALLKERHRKKEQTLEKEAEQAGKKQV